MYKTFLITILLFICLCSDQYCQNNRVTADEATIKERLETIAVENLKSWEPPFYEEEMLKPFVREKDLTVIIDGFPIKGFEQWKKIVYESMQEDRNQEFKKYQHIVKKIRTSILSANSGSVTVIYVGDHITKENIHYKTDAAVTLVFKRIKDLWKIIQFHCSHGRERIIAENND